MHTSNGEIVYKETIDMGLLYCIISTFKGK